MKIGVNARMLIKPYTGIGQHTRYLFRELAKIDKSNEYLLVVPEEISGEVKSDFPSNLRVEILPESKMGTKGMNKTFWEQVMVPEFFRSKNVDIAYFTYPSNPWAKNWYKGAGKTVLTIHDCIPWKDKKYRRGLFSKMYHGKTRKACNKVDKIITVSETSKMDIMDFCGIDSGKIEVIYNDAADIFKTQVDNGFLKKVLEGYGIISYKYFLYCGGYDMRKNVRFLLKNYSEYCEKAAHPYPLVLVGDQLYKDKLYEDFNTKFSSDRGKIINTGFIDETELKALYSGCRAFVHLSKEEGFNIPLIEAVNCGAPLIISDIPVHREIAGDGAKYLNLNDESCAANTMLKFNDSMRAHYAKLSSDISKKYSWQKSAQKLKDVLSLL
ncbi:glycosyltransferase [Candidatus Peregrinibacteria bacterium]|nr:glycosyltransferase [Candidatus Peregrinibacteria bacterium]